MSKGVCVLQGADRLVRGCAASSLPLSPVTRLSFLVYFTYSDTLSRPSAGNSLLLSLWLCIKD